MVAVLYTCSNVFLSVIALFSSRTASRSFELRILNTNSAVAFTRIVASMGPVFLRHGNGRNAAVSAPGKQGIQGLAVHGLMVVG